MPMTRAQRNAALRHNSRATIAERATAYALVTAVAALVLLLVNAMGDV